MKYRVEIKDVKNSLYKEIYVNKNPTDKATVFCKGVTDLFLKELVAILISFFGTKNIANNMTNIIILSSILKKKR